MTEQKKEKVLAWRSTPNAPSIYSNFLHIGWTLDDVRLSFGALKGQDVTGKSHFAEEQGSVVLSWRQAKNLRDMLNRIVGAYEQKNGEIKTPLLAEASEKQI